MDQSVVVEKKDFLSALENLSPSVTEDELYRYKLIRDQFSVHAKSSNIEETVEKLENIMQQAELTSS